MVRGEPKHGFERDVPVEAPIVSEDKLVEIRVDVLAAQPVIGAEPPTFHQREDSIEAAELSGIAARRMRPDRVSRYFARFRLGLALLVPRSITSTAPAIRILPDFTG